MSLVNVTNVVVLDNPTQFTNPFQFEITFECLQDLSEDLEWKVIYVGSSESSDYDQDLEEVLVGPVTAGCHKFVLQADAPNPAQIPHSPLGITVVLITCSYRDHEFVRIGYYVNNDYYQDYYQDHGHGHDHDGNMLESKSVEQLQQEQLQLPLVPRVLLMNDMDGDDDMNMDDEATPSAPPPPSQFSSMDLSKIVRTVLADKPRVTRFAIPWDDTEAASESIPVEEGVELMLDSALTIVELEPTTTTMVAAVSASSPNAAMMDDHLRVVSPTNDMAFG